MTDTSTLPTRHWESSGACRRRNADGVGQRTAARTGRIHRRQRAKVHDGAVWVTNTDQGTLLRIPIGPGGAAGPIQTVATGLPGVDDFTFARNGDILAALNTPSELAVIQPDGTQTIVLTSADGLSNPTAVAVAGNTIYITSAAYITQNDPNLILARLTS